jgi:cell wall-associated NlpC family hydrolase
MTTMSTLAMRTLTLVLPLLGTLFAEQARAERKPDTSAPVKTEQKKGDVLLERRLSAALERAVNRAVMSWLGTPYRWGKAEERLGTDCSGFTKMVAEHGFLVELPRESRDQFQIGRRIRREELRPGDLVFFDPKRSGRVTHVGFYVGNGRFVHASSSRGVRYDQLATKYWTKSYRGARRIVERL